jgi:agmatine/peptidylarginine deiminase
MVIGKFKWYDPIRITNKKGVLRVKKNNVIHTSLIFGILIILVGTAIFPSISGVMKKGNDALSPLPRYREGGTPYDPDQSLQPQTICYVGSKDEPTSGLIASPPEYSPTRGVLFCYKSTDWASVVRDLVVALTNQDKYDEIAYVVVASSSQQTLATNAFTAGGANMSKVQFIIEPVNAIWIRDYGPHFIWQDGALSIVDSHYYPTRPLDNFIPTLLGDDIFKMPTYDMGLYYSGGNFQPGPNRSAFVTSLINTDNPASEGFNASFIAELFHTYQGIDTLNVMPQLPGSVDGTGHIDMWMYLVDNHTVIISKFKPGSNQQAITITENAVPYMQNLGFTVYRTPAWNVGSTHYTYTNAYRVNNRIFIPSYGQGNSAYLPDDAAALVNWTAAAGADVTIIPINCYSIIPAAGAMHCIVMQIPRYTNLTPAVHLISPNGGELFVSGTTQTITWVANDTNNCGIPHIDLYYSTDGGATYNFIATTTNSGMYNWVVPSVITDQAKIKVVARSSDLDETETESTNVFQITPAEQMVYTFATGAGVDKFGYGHQTSSWSSINNNRKPVTTDINSLVSGAYTKIAHSDATGGDTDTNRYISPNPQSNYESTHIYEFTINENPEEIDDLDIHWEGYAKSCTQVELYIWDYITGQWCDAAGHYGQNRFMDNWAGNRDGYLDSHIRSNIFRYINPNGQLTLLLYAERGTFYYSGWYYMPTFHDYIRIIVSKSISIKPEIANVNAAPLVQDINGWVNISCTVTSLVPLQQVTVNITYPDISTVNQTMLNIPGTDAYYYNATYPTAGTYTFFIWAVDTNGNTNYTDIYHFYVGDICGDANNDGIINVADVVYLINYLFIGGPAPVPMKCVGDVNGDGIVNISDVVYLINYLFINGPAPGGCCSGGGV